MNANTETKTYTATVERKGKKFLHRVFLDGEQVATRTSDTTRYGFAIRFNDTGWSYSKTAKPVGAKFDRGFVVQNCIAIEDAPEKVAPAKAEKAATPQAEKPAKAKPAAEPAPDMTAMLVEALAEKGVKVDLVLSPKGAYSRIQVEGVSIGYVAKQTARGIRVELKAQVVSTPAGIKAAASALASIAASAKA